MGHDKKDVVTDPIAKYKRRMKKTCCCGTIWMLLGIILLIVGIVFLAYNVDEWGNDDKKNERNMAYAGVVMLLIGIGMTLIGIIIVVVLYQVYKRLTGRNKKEDMFKSPTFAPGKAPYPQQPVATPQAADAQGPPPVDGAPPMQPASAPGMDQDELTVVVAQQHNNF